jgi:hypothetical protein
LRGRDGLVAASDSPQLSQYDVPSGYSRRQFWHKIIARPDLTFALVFQRDVSHAS